MSLSYRLLVFASLALLGAPTLHAQRSHRSRRHRPPVMPTTPYDTPRTPAELARDLSAELQSRVRSGHWGAIVVSLTRGDTLFESNPDAPMQPASTMKLFTSALALQRLGPDYEFNTQVLRDGPVTANGTVQGDLIIRGDGDPSMSPRFYPGDPDVPMHTLARQIAAAGIRHVTGDVVGDASAFESQRIPTGWLARYLSASYAARVSALSLNDNLVWVAVTPGAGGHPATVALEPSSSVIQVAGTVRTLVGSSGARVVIRSRGDGSVAASGWIGSRSTKRLYELVIDDPALFCTGSFLDALRAQGITVDGKVRMDRAPSTAVSVAELSSPPLARIVAAMNRESINHYAELLFRDAVRGPEHHDVGSADLGAALLERFMTQTVGAAPDAVKVSDGSGLSTLDRITPRAMVQLLSFADRAPWSSAYHASLPVAGESELLRNRMRFTPAQGNLHAKTGTTNNVISLGGYVTATDGEVIAFSIIYNGTDRWNAKTTIDNMGATLASFVRE